VTDPLGGSPQAEAAGDAPTAFNAYLQELQAGQDAAKTSIETRGAAVITSAGAIATLLFGLIAIITAQKNYHVPNWAGRTLFAGVIFLGLAAILAVWTNQPRDYETAKEEGLRRALDLHWDDEGAVMLQRIAATRIDLYYAGLQQNNSKAKLLRRAILAEAIGALFVCLSAACVIANW
jgi:hypothetical protein